MSETHSTRVDREPPVGLFTHILRAVPGVLVFAALGVTLAWGHLNHWTLPKFSSLRGETTAVDDWCSSHSVPDSICVECNDDLLPRPKAHGWCKIHGVHECPLEHPDVAQLPTRPEVTPDDLDRAARALALRPRVENEPKCQTHKRRIQFVSAEEADKAGVEAVPVETGRMVEAVSANGEITYDPTRTARLSARAPGTVFQVLKRVGDPVKAGELIAVVEAAEVGKAKAELVQAVVQLRQKEKLLASYRESPGVVPARTLSDLEAAAGELRIKAATAEQSLNNLGIPFELKALAPVADDDLPKWLRFLGLPATTVATLDAKVTSWNLLPVVAPQDGLVSTRDVVAGEVVSIDKVLLTVVDPRRMWLTLDVGQADAALVKLGQMVTFRPTAGSGETAGAIVWVSTEVTDRTRTVKVRAELENADGKLRSNTFGTGRVIIREEAKAVVVPAAAVHWEGDCHVVFVRDKDYLKPGAPKVYHTRTVRPGVREDGKVEIIAGVLPGEAVAAKGSGTLKAELLRGNLGEG